MTTLAFEQFEKYQTRLPDSQRNFRSSVKYNPASKSIKLTSEGLVFTRNDSRIRSKEMATFQLNVGTAIDSIRKQVQSIQATQGTDCLDFWSDVVSLSDYSTLIDNYDVAAVEEIHMQSASRYGW